ncbi:hypothetical protein [Marixanthomonas ophiurae]|uniref:Lipoprotein n=1 Tax=Marixanthomonas ophiurae TaxID=387659 RepID=A0A3E1QA43_9FLAO|nr:hypothetical protein [Marixanthomonas ophiurae]RFN59000.1 hypothetical protein DZ858_02670 [Marixanthomonas ophiurae]
MTLLKFSLGFLFLFAIACNSTKETPSDNNEMISIEKQNEQKMMDAGFKKGMIVFSEKEGDCPYTIKLEEGDTYYDPINLEESYKKDGEKVWFQFNPLRRMNRCVKANPVFVSEIQKRAE